MTALEDGRRCIRPGHDPAHLCLDRPDERTLPCGDLVLPGYTPTVQLACDGADAVEDFLASLRWIAALAIDLVLPAHGEAYGDARQGTCPAEA